MNALMSSRPRRGACSEYFKSMSGAAISSTTARLTLLPQNSVTQRPSTALLSSCFLMEMDPLVLSEDHRSRSMTERTTTHCAAEPHSASCPGIECVRDKLASVKTTPLGYRTCQLL